ncbi:MAG: exodeoxyribonuclease III [Proteobacteria bacterium]|nr:exodeoxyribonuclease III [Pseudomonadota bacterium]NIS68866.1 exodeoxyribonuclease III [Pseudomonadota bacterium]
MLLRVASFNVNGIRARLPVLVEWIQRASPEVICLQETKVQDLDFPRETLEKLGYVCLFSGQKGFNGVAVLSQEPQELVRIGFDDKDPPDEARLILVRLLGIPILNTYVPQGTAPDSDRFSYKLKWFLRIRRFLTRHFRRDEPLLWVGDFNVAPEPRDVYDPEGLSGSIGFHPEERRALEEVRQWGLVDIFRLHVTEGSHYTFWDYRIPNALARGMGWRVDHIWATDPMARRCRRAWIEVELRGKEKPSDHAPIVAEFEL